MLVEDDLQGHAHLGQTPLVQSGKLFGASHKPRPVLIERAVPAIVDAALWARAQETLRRNRLCRPDIVKRKYLLRGLMKCVALRFDLCGHGE